MIEVLTDAILDVFKLLPFLFVTYLLLEWIETKAEHGSIKLMRQSGAWGPVLGAAVGIVPQCGFSASAANLYAQKLISAGTLLAVFLSTSDEMLPILITSTVPAGTIIIILLLKILIAVIAGLVADKLIHLCRHDGESVDLHALCEREHCHCEEKGIFYSALLHTLKIAGFILIVNLVLNTVITLVGEDTLSSVLTNKPILSCVISALVGLIPNCAASVVITELYVSGALGFGAMMAGLLTASGVGTLVLFRVNRYALKDNLKILLTTFVSGACAGIILELLGIAL